MFSEVTRLDEGVQSPDLQEAYEINKAQKQGTHLLNDQLNLCSSPIFNIIYNILFSSYKNILLNHHCYPGTLKDPPP